MIMFPRKFGGGVLPCWRKHVTEDRPSERLAFPSILPGSVSVLAFEDVSSHFPAPATMTVACRHASLLGWVLVPVDP